MEFKTIKDTEMELMNIDACDLHLPKGKLSAESRLKALKDVLKLIDELQRFGPILAKKLKAKIKG